MITKELKNKIADALLSAEEALSKSKTMVDDLDSEYFDKAVQEDWVLKMYYGDAQIRNSIACDYLAKLEKSLKEIREILKAAEQEASEGEEHEPGTD